MITQTLCIQRVDFTGAAWVMVALWRLAGRPGLNDGWNSLYALMETGFFSLSGCLSNKSTATHQAVIVLTGPGHIEKQGYLWG